MRTMLPAIGLALLAGCGKSDNDPGPGGVTVGEARALDEAAAMIEKRALPRDISQASETPAPAAT